MSVTFNADEIFEIAEQIERNGARFYRKAVGLTSDAKAKGLFDELARMEDRHLKLFQEMHAALAGAEKGSTVFDPEGQGALYLQALADSRVFDTSVDPSAWLTGKESPTQVLRMAIGLEKDSVAFYAGIREMVPETMGKDKVDKIIGEEMSHVTILNKELLKVV